MFMGPYDEGGDWNDRGITGIAKFLNKIHSLIEKETADNDPELDRVVQKTLKAVTKDLDSFKFNTAISRMMEMANSAISSNTLSKANKQFIIKMIAPFSPHLSEELWSVFLGENSSVFNSDWPNYDVNLVVDDTISIAVQVNGKLRGSLEVSKTSDKDSILKLSKDLENVSKYLSSGNLIKEIYVPGKIVNFVIK
tara:strand:+ start:20 stop:604 length:585 start_codon:yes stop_codon:yes gene_type:complete